jgi:hypothetical protein
VTTSIRRLAGAALLATIASTLVGIGTAAPASAKELNGICEHREICFYWGNDYTGARADFYFQKTDFGDIRYPLGTGAGAGQRVKNNAASAINFDTLMAYVYYNENFTGPYDFVPPNGGRRNLHHTWNDNASFRWLA